MEILRSELVAQTSELPAAVLVLIAVLGPLFWVLGWRIHRALFVAASTVVGGIYGLAHGPAFGLYPAVAAGLLSLSAAGLALALLRIGVFVVFGALADYAAGATVAHHLDEHSRGWLRAGAFLAGGLLSLACYRFLIVLVTSFAGAFLLLLGGLAFAAKQGEFDTVALSAERPGAVTAALILLGLIGTLGQYAAEGHRRRSERPRESQSDMLRKLLRSRSE